jgi:hypothetical protein
MLPNLVVIKQRRLGLGGLREVGNHEAHAQLKKNSDNVSLL